MENCKGQPLTWCPQRFQNTKKESKKYTKSPIEIKHTTVPVQFKYTKHPQTTFGIEHSPYDSKFNDNLHRMPLLC